MDGHATPPVKAKDRPTGWLIAFRLVMFCLLVGATLYQGAWGAQDHVILWAYLAVTLSFLLFYRRLHHSRLLTVTRYLGGLQIFLEVAMEGVLMLHANSFTSPFVLLFLLTIISASLYFRLVGTLMVATACSITVTITMFLSVVGPNPAPQAVRDFSTVLNLNDDLFYALFLYICAFFLAAFVSGYLSEKLELKDRALAGASEALALARLETDDILQNMQSGLLSINAAGTLVFFNSAAEDILGYRQGEVTGRHCRSVFGARMPRLADLLLSALEARQGEARTELEITTLHGNVIPVGISTSVLGSSSSIRGVIAVFQDITAAKRLEERVRVADRLAAVGELSAGIAHEIRNPLATISGSVEMLQRDLQPDGDGQTLMNMILKESVRLNKIVEDFLDFARVKQQACNAVDIGAMLREVVETFDHHPSRTPHSRIALDLPSEAGPLAAGSEGQIRQILVNLIQNALEALPEGRGDVRITAGSSASNRATTPRLVEITVADSGTGIPPQVAERIGQPFFSTKKGGTGLGVAIVQRLAAAMGGSVHWESPPEQGTRFIVRLPAYSQEQFMQEVSDLYTARSGELS